jgi:hypothetical protein
MTLDLTLNGRLPLPAGVTEAKLLAMKDLVEGTKRGNRLKAGTLVEVMTTSDAVFNFTHLTNLNVLEQYDAAPRTWTEIATERVLSDFRPAVFYSLLSDWDDATLGTGTPTNVSPIVPETTAYPYASLRGEEYQAGSILKRGFKVGLSWELLVNDAVGYVNALPGEILRVALDTEEYEVYNALIGGVGAGQQIQAGSNPDGTTFPVNAPLTRAALIGAIAQLGARKINGRQVVIRGGYNLIVAVGQKANAEYQIHNTLLTGVQSGTAPTVLTFSTDGYNPLSDITVIESPYVTAPAWYLIPKKGQVRPILELGKLAGHEAPELRVNNATGNYLGGASVAPFEGSFSNDTVDLRVRQVLQGLNWTPSLIVWSEGDGN